MKKGNFGLIRLTTLMFNVLLEFHCEFGKIADHKKHRNSKETKNLFVERGGGEGGGGFLFRFVPVGRPQTFVYRLPATVTTKRRHATSNARNELRSYSNPRQTCGETRARPAGNARGDPAQLHDTITQSASKTGDTNHILYCVRCCSENNGGECVSPRMIWRGFKRKTYSASCALGGQDVVY